MRNLSSLLGPAGLFLSTLLVSGAASAQSSPRTAVMPFEGRSARAIQQAVSRAIDDRVSVIDTGEVRRAAADAGAEGTSGGGVSELAGMVGADLVVQGRVTGPRRTPRVEIVVRAADGAELARGSTRYSRSRAARRRFSAQAQRIVEDAVSAWSARRPPEPIETPMPPPEEEPEPMAPPPAEAPQDGLAILSGTIGVTVRNRDAALDLAAGGHRTYSSGAYPEIALAVEARPFANDAHLGRGLYLQGSFGHSLGLRSVTEDLDCTTDPAPAGCNVGTNFLRFAVGAGWLAPIEDIAEVGAGVTVGYDGYELAPNTVMPSAEYVYVRPGARGRIRLAREALVLDLEVAYRGVVGVGALATSFGEEAEAHGVDVGVGLGGNLFPVLDLGFTWAVRFDYVHYALSFAGAANDAPASGGSESSARVTLLVGWSIK